MTTVTKMVHVNYRSNYNRIYMITVTIDTNISFNLSVMFNTLQLATGVTGLYSQGGDSGCSWVFCLCTGPNFRCDYTLGLTGLLRYALELSTLWSTPVEKIQMSSFQCNLY